MRRVEAQNERDFIFFPTSHTEEREHVRKDCRELLLWLNRLRIQHGVREDAASLGGLRIHCCCKLRSRLQMLLGSSVAVAVSKATATALIQLLAQETSVCRRCSHEKKKKDC